MSMRTHGEIDGVYFTRLGFSIAALATKYKLYSVSGVSDSKIVYADTMKELRQQIKDYNQVEYEKD